MSKIYQLKNEEGQQILPVTVTDAVAAGQQSLTAVLNYLNNVDSSISNTINNLNSSVKNINDRQTTAETAMDEIPQQISSAISELILDAPENLDTLKEISEWISDHADSAADMNNRINTNKNDISIANSSINSLYSQVETKIEG